MGVNNMSYCNDDDNVDCSDDEMVEAIVANELINLSGSDCDNKRLVE